MNETTRRRALIFLLIAAVLTVLVAAGLPQLKLQPGIPLPRLDDKGGDSTLPYEPPITISVSTLFKTILAAVLTLAVVFIVYKILRKVSWKQILVRFLYFAIAITAGSFALMALGDLNLSLNPTTPEMLPSVIKEEGPPLATMPPDIMWVAWIILALFIISLVAWLVIWVFRWRRSPGDRLAVEAKRALEALKLNQDFKDVIMQCYWQMSQALRQEQGIVLEETMTAREFESLAEARGIPYTPVHQLTQLFEFVRYGFRAPGPSDEQKAIECLNAIVQFSRERRETP